MSTKKELEKEMHQLRQKTLELQGENNKLYDDEIGWLIYTMP